MTGRPSAGTAGWRPLAGPAWPTWWRPTRRVPPRPQAPDADDRATHSPGTEAPWTDNARGGIDDDEHLAAYNAFLARLNQAEPGRRP